MGNGAALTGIVSSYGNANVAANLAAFGSNPISTTGNVTAGYFVGNGSLLSSITGANVTGTVANATTATTAGTVTTAAQANITSVGTLTSLSVSGNIVGGNINTAGAVSTTGRVIGLNYTETVHAIGSSGGTITPNISLGSIQSITLTSNMTFSSITNIQAGQSFTFIVTQDGTGSRTLTSTMKFAGNSRTLSTAANSIDVISVFYNGSTYFASLTKGYA